MILTYRYQLNLRPAQRRNLESILDAQRWLYNEALGWRKFAWEVYGVSISFVEQCRWLTGLRKKDDRESRVSAQLQQATLKRLDNAFAAFFRRVKDGKTPGYPRFKSKDRFDSFGFRSFQSVHFDGKRAWFKGVRGRIRLNVHRPLPKCEKILGCTFKRLGTKWEIALQLRLPTPPEVETKTAVGVDVGLSSLATLSTGEKVENIRPTKQAAAELRVAQRALSRCERGSNRRQKVKAEVIRCHAKIRSARETHLHRVSRDLVNRFDLIAVEDLNIKGLCRTMLAKAIYDAAWGKLNWYVAYKAEGAGKHYVQVRAAGTTTECSGCGEHVPKALSDRMHICPSCGLILPRDHNSALVILHRAGRGPERPNVADYRERAAGLLIST